MNGRQLQLVLSSVPLRQLNEQGIPYGFASGCIVAYRGYLLLMSVSHAIKPEHDNWVIQLGYNSARNLTEVYKPKCFNFLGEMKLGESKIKRIDLCYTLINKDVAPLFQHITPFGGISYEEERRILHADFEAQPDFAEKYGFSGEIRAELHNQNPATELAIYDDLTYQGQSGQFLTFKLPHKHQGHEYFQGCSGAPMLDKKGNVVALVSHGNPETDSIYGVSLNRHKIAFDILVGDLDINAKD